MRETIQRYLGTEALSRFAAKREAARVEYESHLQETGLKPIIDDLLENYNDED